MTEQFDGQFDLCSLEELQARSAMGFLFVHPQFGKHEIGVFWDGEAVHALENYCPHEGGMLSHGFIALGEVVCPLHAAVFDLKTGECLDKYTTDTTSYQAEVRAGRVWVVAPGQTRANA